MNSNQLSVISDQPVDLTESEELYRPISEYGEAHLQAMASLSKAVVRGDEVGMKKFFDQVCYFEQAQRQAGIEFRKLLLHRLVK